MTDEDKKKNQTPPKLTTAQERLAEEMYFNELSNRINLGATNWVVKLYDKLDKKRALKENTKPKSIAPDSPHLEKGDKGQGRG
ncbi:MAG: hypothetical protein ABL867_10170 [Rickettsiales bacterium]